MLRIVRRLAINTEPDSGHGFAAPLGNTGAALFAFLQAGAFGSLAAHALNGILDAGVDLILHRSVFRPTAGPVLLHA